MFDDDYLNYASSVTTGPQNQLKPRFSSLTFLSYLLNPAARTGVCGAGSVSQVLFGPLSDRIWPFAALRITTVITWCPLFARPAVQRQSETHVKFVLHFVFPNFGIALVLKTNCVWEIIGLDEHQHILTVMKRFQR